VTVVWGDEGGRYEGKSFELGFEEVDVVQGEIEDTLDRKSERLFQE
jgi:hypothetical protein